MDIMEIISLKWIQAGGISLVSTTDSLEGSPFFYFFFCFWSAAQGIIFVLCDSIMIMAEAGKQAGRQLNRGRGTGFS